MRRIRRGAAAANFLGCGERDVIGSNGVGDMGAWEWDVRSWVVGFPPFFFFERGWEDRSDERGGIVRGSGGRTITTTIPLIVEMLVLS